jgi:hypothetical protein
MMKCHKQTILNRCLLVTKEVTECIMHSLKVYQMKNFRHALRLRAVGVMLELVTRSELEGFTEEYERPLPDPPTSLVERLRDWTADTFGVSLF